MSDIPWPKRTRRALRVRAIQLGLWLGGLIPFRLAWAIGTLAGRAAWWFGRRDRTLCLEHLAIAFPELSGEERRAIARDVFLHFGHGAMEVAQIERLTPELERYVHFSEENAARLRDAYAAGKGILFVTGHLGSWELLARRLVRVGVPATVVATRSWHPRLNDMVVAFRARGGVTTIFREDPSVGRKLLGLLRDGGNLGMLIDQDTDVQSVFVPFFGRLASTPRAAADLALRFGCPVFVGWSRRRGPRPGDGYVLEMEPVPFDPAPPDREAEVVRITAHCTARIEHAIRQAPAEWVWMHRRWKTNPPESRRD